VTTNALAALTTWWGVAGIVAWKAGISCTAVRRLSLRWHGKQTGELSLRWIWCNGQHAGNHQRSLLKRTSWLAQRGSHIAIAPRARNDGEEENIMKKKAKA
jgi:hypothetical protein